MAKFGEKVVSVIALAVGAFTLGRAMKKSKAIADDGIGTIKLKYPSQVVNAIERNIRKGKESYVYWNPHEYYYFVETTYQVIHPDGYYICRYGTRTWPTIRGILNAKDNFEKEWGK